MQLIRVSPRFGIMLLFMLISIVFGVVDAFAVLGGYHLGYPAGIEPFWKVSCCHRREHGWHADLPQLAFVFKCLSDTIILDDFKSALDRLRYHHHPDGLAPHETEIHARGRSTRRLVERGSGTPIKRPDPACGRCDRYGGRYEIV